jgi:tRNA 2-thiouridine synthesizing protein A
MSQEPPAPVIELDCTGLLCPLPVYRTRQAMARLTPGTVLRVDCTDPGSLADVPAFAREQGHTLLGVMERSGVFVFDLRKEPAAAPAPR